MERKLASIQKILTVEPIEGADKIEKVKVLGWQCVAVKGEFKPGDKCIYVEVGSMLPIEDKFESLRKSCYKKMHTGEEGFRIKTIKLRGCLSQGIALPLTFLGEEFTNSILFKEGDDVTTKLGVFQYYPYIPPENAGEVWGKRPWFVPFTDETRVQSAPETINELKGKEVYITTKLDGTSVSIYSLMNGPYCDPTFPRQFGVCSRENELKEKDTNTLWKIVNQYNLKEKLSKYGEPIVIQGELCGPGIQKNRLKLHIHDWYVFDIYFPKQIRYASYQELTDLCTVFQLKMVPLMLIGTFNWNLDQLLKLAEGEYVGTLNLREGIVIRPTVPIHSPTLAGRLSIKVLNNTFLLKEEE